MRRIYSRQIKKQAVSVLAERQVDYRRLVLGHAAVSSGVMLVISLIGMLIDLAVTDVQGISGLGTVGKLKTISTVCMLLGTVLMPFWDMGILYTSVRVARRQNTEFSMLTRGFQRIGPLIRYYVIYFIIVFIVAMGCLNLSVFPALCIPAPQELTAAMESLDLTDMAQIEAFQQEYMDQMRAYSIPFMVIWAVLYGTAAMFLNYCFRVSQYLLLDEEKIGALAAFRASSRLTKGERKNLFLLDLSFWWYYALVLLLPAVRYIPDVLQAAGVTLPVSYETANFIAYLGYMVCYLLLTALAGAYYHTSIACAYEALRTAENENE